ncbi:acyl-CoA carboxylase subunit epsilon [Kitasatospora mediocidica]|uniref:acyl-CoA carboxylase subunit epsilon n=1 Tax=Kitasatospora mediocidica TaxID=58352 RepID=UPI00056B0EF3|nr:acyl-CoA carboxylase subunit epsilon [Kitasatospora mediocidica]
MTITVTRGTLTDEELAALTVVLLARAAAQQAAAAAAGEVGIVRLRRRVGVDYTSPLSWQEAA